MKASDCVLERERAPVSREVLLEKALVEVLGALRTIASEYARTHEMAAHDVADRVRRRVLIAERLLERAGGD